MSDASRRWTAEEAESILRRAIELQANEMPTVETTYSEADLERLGEELGVSAIAVRRAMVELRNEQLAKPSQLPDRLDRWFGPRWFVAHRSVPGPRRAVAEVVVKTMHEQLFQVQRNFGNTVVFVSSTACLEPMHRAMEVQRRQYLPLAEVVMVTVTDAVHRQRFVDVRLEVGMPNSRRQRIQNAALSLGFSGGAGAALGVLLGLAVPAALPILLASLAVGGGVAMDQRRTYRRELLGLRANMERFLDYLEHERL